MAGDKSYMILLNKYNVLLAQSKDLKEQLEKQKMESQRLLDRSSVIEKNIRELCEDILAKDPSEMKLGVEYSWDKIELLELIQKSNNAFHHYIKQKKDFMERLADECEDRGKKIESLSSQIEEMTINPAARNIDIEVLQKRSEEIQKRNELAKKMPPSVENAVHKGNIQLIQGEENDPVIEEEESLYEGVQEIGADIKTQITPKSIPGTSMRKKIQKKKESLFALENYQDTIDQLDDISKLIMKIIGEKGYSKELIIRSEASKLNPMISETRLRSTFKYLKGFGIIEEEIISIKGKFFVCYFTSKGRQIYKAIFDNSPVLSEAEKIITEHNNLIHGYGIMDVAEILRQHIEFKTISEWNRKKPINLHNGTSYIPDIICETKEGRKMYIEFECGNHTQINFNAKCNKMLSVTPILNFIVPNRKVEETIITQVNQWIKNKGQQAISHATVRITSSALIDNVNLLDNKSWHYVYILEKSITPEIN